MLKFGKPEAAWKKGRRGREFHLKNGAR